MVVDTTMKEFKCFVPKVFMEKLYLGIAIPLHIQELPGATPKLRDDFSSRACVPLPEEFLPQHALSILSILENYRFKIPEVHVLDVGLRNTKTGEHTSLDSIHASWPKFLGTSAYLSGGFLYADIEFSSNIEERTQHHIERKYESNFLFSLPQLETDPDYLDIFSLLDAIRKANAWKTSLRFEAYRHSISSIVSEKVGAHQVKIMESISLVYEFDQKYIKIQEGHDSGNRTFAHIDIGKTSDNNIPVRPPRLSTLSDLTTDNPQVHHFGYDLIVKKFLPNRKIPLKESLEGMPIEQMMQEVMPNVLDSLLDFVEN